MAHTYIGSFAAELWVLSQILASPIEHMKESWHAQDWVMAHTHAGSFAADFERQLQMSHVIGTNRSCRLREGFVAQKWMSHGTHIYRVVYSRTSKISTIWVTSQISMRHVAHVYESWHTYEWIMAHIHTGTFTAELHRQAHGVMSQLSLHLMHLSHAYMSHGTHVNESWHIGSFAVDSQRQLRRVMRAISMRHVTHIYELRHTYEWNMAHAHNRVFCRIQGFYAFGDKGIESCRTHEWARWAST